jgi:hypothetical protein
MDCQTISATVFETARPYQKQKKHHMEHLSIQLLTKTCKKNSEFDRNVVSNQIDGSVDENTGVSRRRTHD